MHGRIFYIQISHHMISDGRHALLQVENFFEKSSREQQQGLDFEGIPDADLFFVDKTTEHDTTVIPTPTSRKIYHRHRLTRAQAILQAIHSTKPAFELPKTKKAIKISQPDPVTIHKHTKPAAKESKNKKALAAQHASTTGKRKSSTPLDLWENDGNLGRDAAARADTVTHQPIKPTRASTRKSMNALAAAILIDDPGCSFNPDKEMHQDAVAMAVATEMKKIYDQELAPKPPTLLVNYDPQMDEVALLQVDAASDENEDEEEENEEDIEMSAAARAKKNEKKTKKDRNREVKRRALEEELQRTKKEKKQRVDIANLKQIQSEVEETLKERELKRKRKEANKAEKAASEPPRLGKHKFENMPLQVLTTEELGETQGSLRLLKPTVMLAKDRFKSLQRRGMIEPRNKVSKKVGRKIKYIPGERAEKAMERQTEVDEMRSKKGRKKK